MIAIISALMFVVILAVFFGLLRPLKREAQAVTDKAVKQAYQSLPSFTDWLPWVDYDSEQGTFLLEDGVSVGVLLEVSMIPTEAKPQEYLANIEEQLRSVLNHTIPEEDNPYVLQFFVQDDPDIDAFSQQYAEYVEARNQAPFAKHFVNTMQQHFRRIANPKGYFEDTAVTGSTWHAQQRRARLCLYKRLTSREQEQIESSSQSTYAPSERLNEVVERLTTQLQSSGIRVKRGDANDLLHWLLAWFNPTTLKTLKPEALQWQAEQPFGMDLSRLVNLTQPVSDQEHGVWDFDGWQHQVLTVDGLRRVPQHGHITGERALGEHHYALFDRLASGSMVSLTVVIQPQDSVQNHLSRIQGASKGESAESLLAGEEAKLAQARIQQGDHLYPTMFTVFVRGESLEQLKRRVTQTHALLIANGLHAVAERHQLLPLDAYIRNLPMNYEPQQERVYPLSRLMFSSHVSKLLPLWGRSRGTANPGLIFFNRGAEPVVFDPFNPKDRVGNAFGLILGPPGSGKSALTVYLLMQMLACYNARIVVIEKGGSFQLFGEHCKRMGLSVNSVFLHHKHDVSLPPFANALMMLEQEERQRAINVEQLVQRDLDEESVAEAVERLQQSHSDDDEERDYLGEMELQARFMITGGDTKEEERLSRSDRLLIRQAIVQAAIYKRDTLAKQKQMEQKLENETVLTIDVVTALRVLGDETQRREVSRVRAHDMADAMALFCEGVQGKFFNRPGCLWPEADVTILELGIFAQDAYKDGLALAFTGLMNIITAIVERDQHTQRPTIIVGDEPHLLLSNPLLASYWVKLVKMFRKLGCWPWLATQNLEDFPHDARKMLSLFEWFIAMTCPREQVELIADFKELTPEQKSLLLATRKEPKKYTEGCVISPKLLSLIRNVPPPLALALAQTEQHEKAQRARIMQEHQCSELDAAYKIAEHIAATYEQETSHEKQHL